VADVYIHMSDYFTLSVINCCA